MISKQEKTVDASKILGIFGAPRSGTTWLGKIFDSSPETLYIHEPGYCLRLPSVPYVVNVAEAEAWSPFIRDWIERVFLLGSQRMLGKLPQFSKSYISSTPERASNFWWRGRLLASALNRRLTQRESLYPLPNFLTNAPFKVWKSVESLGRLGAFARTLDDHRFIQLVRHPCGFIDSVMRGDKGGYFQKEIAMSADLGLMKWAMTAPCASKYDIEFMQFPSLSPEIRLAWFWLLMNEQAFLDCEGMSHVRLVWYDDLCARPLELTQELFDFAGLSMSDQTREFVQPARQFQSDDYFSVHKSPKDMSSRWKNSLSPQIADEVLRITEPFMSRLQVRY